MLLCKDPQEQEVRKEILVIKHPLEFKVQLEKRGAEGSEGPPGKIGKMGPVVHNLHTINRV